MEHPDSQDQLQELQRENEQLKEEHIRISEQYHTSAEKQWQVSRDYQQSQLRFRTVFESSPIGNKIIDKDLKILQANMAMVRLLGFTEKEEVIGKKILDYTPKEYIKDWKFLQQQLWGNNSTTFSLESALIRKDGALIRCRITSNLFADQNETLGFTTIEDITEQYNLLKQKEEFISVASHELKTPVTSLKASIQLIHKFIKGGSGVNDTLTGLADRALVAVSRLTHLVEDLLSTTRLEQGQLPLNSGWFEIGAVLDSSCDHLLLQGKYSLIFSGDRELKVYGDQYKVEQVIINLVNNAIKYAPDSLEISVYAEQLAHGVRVSVVDKGAGIPVAAQSRLFERYYRVNDQISSASSGLGLGLYICAEIIRRHSGEIGIESDAGQGCNFWFTLPSEPSN